MKKPFFIILLCTAFSGYANKPQPNNCWETIYNLYMNSLIQYDYDNGACYESAGYCYTEICIGEPKTDAESMDLQIKIEDKYLEICLLDSEIKFKNTISNLEDQLDACELASKTK